MSTYADLIAAVIDETKRDDLAAQVPLFIRRAESMIARELRAVEMIAQTVLTDSERTSFGSPIYNLPAAFLEDRSFIAQSRVLRKLSVAGLVEYRMEGPTYVYALRSNAGAMQATFRGNPGDGAEIDVEFFARPAALTDPGDSNALLTNHDGVYHHAATFALYKFTQDLELAQAAYEAWFNAVDTLNEQAGRFLGGANAQSAYNLGHKAIGRGY